MWTWQYRQNSFSGKEKRGHMCGTEEEKRKESERESRPEIGGAFWQTVGIHFTPK